MSAARRRLTPLTPRRCSVTAAMLTAMLAAVSCGGDDPAGPSVRARVLGTWTLETVDGRPLPYRAAYRGSTACDIVVVSGSLRVSDAVQLNRFEYHDQITPHGTAACTAADWHDAHDIGWGVNADGTIAVNLLFPSAVEQQTARLDGDVLVLTYRDGFRLPDGEYRFRKAP